MVALQSKVFVYTYLVTQHVGKTGVSFFKLGEENTTIPCVLKFAPMPVVLLPLG